MAFEGQIPPGGLTKPISLRLPKALRAHTIRLADRDGLSVSEWIRRAIEEAIFRESNPNP